MSIYGPLVTIEDVRLALTSHLRMWAPTYIEEVARHRGLTLPAFRGYAAETADSLPVCVTACAAAENPTRHGDGAVSARFVVEAAAVVSAPTREEATAVAGYYGAAIRGAVLQHRDLSGFAAGTYWDGEAIEEVAFDTERAIVACTVRFLVDVDNVINTHGGPLEPPTNPTVDPGDWPTVDTIDVDVHRTPTEDTTP